MAYTDVINTTGNLFQTYSQFAVYLGNTSGNVPTGSVFPSTYCSRVVQSAGGSRLDYADLETVLLASLKNRSQPAGFSRMVQVDLPDSGATRIHLGDYVTEDIAIGQDAESLRATSQLRAYHFGGPVVGYKVFDKLSADYVVIEDDIVFNPVVDDRTVGNRSSKIDSINGFSSYVWTHPELADTTTGETYQGQTRSAWTLQEAVKSVCELLNADEVFVLNPTSYTTLSTAPPINNLTIRLGLHLHEVLDTLLIAHGFNWYVDYTTTTPTIKLFQIGVGTQKELKFQAPGELLDLSLSNTNELSVSNGIGDAFNQVKVFGEFEEAEVTIPLYAAWPADRDSLDTDELSKDGSEYEGNETVWRLFIANEAGDIDPAVDRFGQTPTVPDFSTVFAKATPHRRTLGEPLTYLTDTENAEQPQRRPIVLEWYNSTDGEWQYEATSWTVKLCPDQIGILFDGKDIPEELVDESENLRLRITGTIFGDSRVSGLAAKESWSVNGRTYQHVMTMPEKFHKRWRQSSGTFASTLIAGGNDADERDDSTEIQTYAEAIRNQNQYADVECEFRLPGWHTEYQIGDLITKIVGREISLDAAPSTSPDTRFVQIVERRFEMSDAGPSTVLIVDRGTTNVYASGTATVAGTAPVAIRGPLT